MNETSSAFTGIPLSRLGVEASPSGVGPRRVVSPVEWVVAGIILLVTLFLIFPEVRGMATMSLYNDEIYTVQKFSSKGPRQVLTDYRAPNNHMFYNLVNSVTRGSRSCLPGRARLFSFLSVAAMVVLVGRYFVQQGRPVLGALLLFWLFANLTYLDVILQARGYGFLALGASLCCMGTLRYFQRQATRDIVLVATAVWLATWSVPSFIFFGGPLLLLVTGVSRDKRWLFAGMICLVLIVCSYWAVHVQLLHNADNYGDEWGEAFKSWEGLHSFLNKYLLFGWFWHYSWVTFLLFAALIAGAQALRRSEGTDLASLLIGAAVLVTFLICLKLRTPSLKSMSFIVVPLAFVAMQILHRLVYREEAVLGPLIAHGAMVIGVIALSWTIWRGFTYVPIENWLGTARKIQSEFPKQTGVLAPFRPEHLRAYLKSSDYPKVTTFNRESFLRGELVVVDSSFRDRDNWDVKVLPKGFRTFVIPQQRGGYQRIYYYR
ncbi:MAG: hypothetical protein ABIT76_09820 [Chthoniobacterales bacterium]